MAIAVLSIAAESAWHIMLVLYQPHYELLISQSGVELRELDAES
jgi:hypothetical protein